MRAAGLFGGRKSLLIFTVCTQRERASSHILSSAPRSPYRRGIRGIRPRLLPGGAHRTRPAPCSVPWTPSPPTPAASAHWAEPSPGAPIGQPRSTPPRARPLPTNRFLLLGSSVLADFLRAWGRGWGGAGGGEPCHPLVLKPSKLEPSFLEPLHASRLWRSGCSGHAHSVGLG